MAKVLVGTSLRPTLPGSSSLRRLATVSAEPVLWGEGFDMVKVFFFFFPGCASTHL